MEISVVVPTRDRPAKLRRCLAALRAHAGPEIELLVVDDGSAEAAAVAAVARRAEATLVRLDGSGPAAARNAGARAAQGKVVCFIDDDCEARAGWAEELAGPILAGEASSAAGRTVVAEEAGAADRAWQAIADYLQEKAGASGSSSPGFAATCNLACSTSVLVELPFDESFPLAAGEDRDWAARAAALGVAPVFVAAAEVVHRPGLDPRSFLRQQFRYGSGAARYRAVDRGRQLGSPSFYSGLLRAGFAAGPGAGALVCAAQLATAAGILSARAAARRPARP